MNYTDKNFDITEIEGFDTIECFTEISNYLDFAISTTMKKHFPLAQGDSEVMQAINMVRGFLQGDSTRFTDVYNIRENINKIGIVRIKFLLWKTLIERKAFNKHAVKFMTNSEKINSTAVLVTELIARGEFSMTEDWYNRNMDSLILNYIILKYKKDTEIKEKYDAFANENPLCKKALEQLEMELQLQQVKEK